LFALLLARRFILFSFLLSPLVYFYLGRYKEKGMGIRRPKIRYLSFFKNKKIIKETIKGLDQI
jgi:hypothetical protein